MNAEHVLIAFQSITYIMNENKEYLSALDAQNGDGDLGISMCNGFSAVTGYLSEVEERDLGRLFLKCSTVFNEAAPSSLGAILSFFMMGMARELKGKYETDVLTLSRAMKAGVEAITEKSKAKQGEKTILDALCPGIIALEKNATEDDAFKKASQAAAQGAQSTKEIPAVHGRAAYYTNKSVGLLDGGAVVGKLIFDGVLQSLSR